MIKKVILLVFILSCAMFTSARQTDENAAYAVALLTIKNTQKMAEYIRLAGPLIEHYGGRVIAKGHVNQVFTGHLGHGFMAVAEFPNTATVNTFYYSEAYQALIPLRDEAATVIFANIGSQNPQKVRPK